MDEAEYQEQQRQKYLALIPKFRLLDDEFLHACMRDNKPAAQLVLRIVLEKKGLEVKRVVVQREMKNLVGHSLELDVYAEDEQGSQLDVEIQRNDAGAAPERAVYHSGTLDANSLVKGEKDFRRKSETYVVMFT